MTMTIMPEGRQRYFDNEGNLAVGCLLYTYAAGTSTPKAAYQDAAGAVPHTNPVQLDAKGEAVIYWSGAYKIDLKTSAGAQVTGWPVDNVTAPLVLGDLTPSSGAGAIGFLAAVSYPVGSIGRWLVDLATSAGSSLIGFIQSGASAVLRSIQDRLRDEVSACDFMTVAQIADIRARTGALDVTTAIQAAVNSGASSVYLPGGVYRISSPISMPLRVSLRGDGGMLTIIRCYSCDGLMFTNTGYDQDSTSIRDIGLFGMSGANYTAINSPTGTGTKYGLHFDRVVISDFNQGIIFENNLHCSISRCRISYVNTAITLGDISTLTHIFNNTIIATGGTTHGGTAASIGINIPGGSNCEAIKIRDNFIFGFAKGIQIATVTDVIIAGNGIDACTLYGIIFTAVQHNFNIKDNFIELTGAAAVAGICGLPLGSGEYLSQIAIEGNSFTVLGGGALNASGIIFNTTVDTFQFHLRIVGNVFNNMSAYDMKLNLPGETLVENNRCMSVLVNNIWIGSVNKAPVFVAKNWVYGAIYTDVAADVTTGKIILDHNSTGNTFVPYRGTFTPAYSPVAGAFGAITYAYANGSFCRQGDLCWFNLTIVESAHAIGTASGELRLINLPFTAAATVQQTPIAIGDAYGWGANTPCTGVILAGTTTMQLDFRAAANGPTAVTLVTDMTVGAAGTYNRLTISGTYLCA